MTIQDICDTALTLLFENSITAPEYVEKTTAIINVLVPEIFDINNDLRLQKNLKPLSQWPIFKNLEDDAVFEPELCRAALPYGLATNLLLGDEEDTRAINYNAKYVDAVNACIRINPQSVKDVYEGIIS